MNEDYIRGFMEKCAVLGGARGMMASNLLYGGGLGRTFSAARKLGPEAQSTLNSQVDEITRLLHPRGGGAQLNRGGTQQREAAYMLRNLRKMRRQYGDAPKGRGGWTELFEEMV